MRPGPLVEASATADEAVLVPMIAVVIDVPRSVVICCAVRAVFVRDRREDGVKRRDADKVNGSLPGVCSKW